jgi:carboxyl-terminal processing protease
MKKITFIICLLLLAANTFAQPQLTENAKLASLCKIWGFLKYYHPEVAKGKRDWDRELMEHIPQVRSATNSHDLSTIYTNWIADLSSVKELRKPLKPFPDTMLRNFDIRWMNDNTLFTPELSGKLHFLEQNKKGSKNYYVRRTFPTVTASFRNEKTYTDSVFPSENMRLLALFRYWNIIHYYFPYKSIIGEDWNQVLEDMIPVFKNAADTVQYAYAIRQLTARTNDSHAGLSGPKSLGGKFELRTPAFKYRIIDNMLLITGFYNDSLARIDDLKYGDLISSVNDVSIPQIIASVSKYTGASNEPARLNKMSNNFAMVKGEADSIKIEFERDGRVSSKTIRRYYLNEFNYDWKKKESKPSYKFIDSNIGYIDLDVLKPREVNKAIKTLGHTKAIIVDVRNYPHVTVYKLVHRLTSERKPFVLFESQVWSHPGVFKKEDTSKCGRKRRRYYGGKLLVLHDETTQSAAEFTCMALQTCPNLTCIGSQTSGADGNVSKIPFPGGFSTYMTGLGVFYPDGRPTQRIGIVPDIEVKPTIEGIRQHRDEVLERAIEYARAGK